MKEFIEIPFGDKDSKLEGWEYTIPEGYKASIENGKIIVKKEESGDEKIRKWIINEIKIKYHNLDEANVDFVDKAIAWLEKQGEHKPTDEEMKILLQTEYEKGKADALQEQRKEWTAEDKERYISCLQRLGTGNPEQPETINSKWFKEHVYSQTTWKPSDEQLNALDEVYKTHGANGACRRIIFNLLEQLKKL